MYSRILTEKEEVAMLHCSPTRGENTTFGHAPMQHCSEVMAYIVRKMFRDCEQGVAVYLRWLIIVLNMCVTRDERKLLRSNEEGKS